MCKRITYVPVVAPCNHIFCEDCLREKLRKGPRCPAKGCLRAAVPLSLAECRPLAEADPKAEQVRGAIDVRCRLFARGCRWKGSVRELVPHKEVCRFVTLLCKNKGCGDKLERRLMKEHSTACEFYVQKLPCLNCGGAPLAYAALQVHVERQCPSFYGWVLVDDEWSWGCPTVRHAQRMSEAAATLAKRIAKMQAESEGMRMNTEAATALMEARQAKATALASKKSKAIEAAEEAFVQATVQVGKVSGARARDGANALSLLTLIRNDSR